MKNTQKVIFNYFIIFLISYSTFAQVQIVEMACEHRQKPVGVDVLNPRMSWKLKSSERNFLQTAYQIRVAMTSTFEKKNLVWDSQKLPSGVSILQSYQGQTLQSRSEERRVGKEC